MIPLGIVASSAQTYEEPIEAYLYRDEFDRADNPSSLGTVPDGPTWSNWRGTFGVLSEGAKCYSSTGYSMAAFDTGLSNYRIEWEITTAYDGYAGFIFRGVNWLNFLYIYVEDTSPYNAYIYRITSGVPARLSSGYPSTSAIGPCPSGTKLEVYCDGFDYDVYKDGVFKESLFTTSHSSGTKVGLLSNGPLGVNNIWDNVTVREL